MNRIPALAGLASLAAGVLVAQHGESRLNARDLYYAEISSDATAGHLGARYNILLTNDETARAVDPDRTFHTGECFLLELQANAKAYIYVYSRTSDGSLELLYPSSVGALSNVVEAGSPVRVPQQACFELTEPKRQETMIAILAREPIDLTKLLPVVDARMIPAHLAHAVRQQLGARDIQLKKIDSAAAPGERPYSVYAVSTSILLLEIHLRHE